MNMKMKMLTAAVTAALGAGSAHAVNVSQDGLGQVLIMPYYTVQGDNDTLISVTNATNQVKAVKVRFREAQNSREVLDFNLYLSPYDVWTGKVTNHSAGGAKLITNDTSCTVPAIPVDGVAFRPYNYDGRIDKDAGDSDIARTSEGYVEVLEMGVVIAGSNPAKAATHTEARIPANCDYLVKSWTTPAPGDSVKPGDPLGRWVENNTLDMEKAAGGLFGEANIINVAEGVEGSEPVTVLDNFFNQPNSIHRSPGSTEPSLANAEAVSAVFLSGSGAVEVDTWTHGIDAVSAVLMASSIMNGYSINPAVGSSTEWVINFPTKHFYTDQTTVPEPFKHNFGAQGSPEAISIAYWDREEQSPFDPEKPGQPVPPDFSPELPCVPGVDPGCTIITVEPPVLPWEVNVLRFNTEDHTSDFLNSQWAGVDLKLKDPSGIAEFANGWAKIGFGKVYNSDGVMRSANRELISKEDTVFNGLPVVGFMATILTNANVGVGAAYASTAEHRYMRDISTSK